MRYSSLLIACLATASLACFQEITSLDITETAFAPGLNVDLSTMTRTASGLYYKDLVVGSGALVMAGQQVGVRYSASLPNGLEFDSNEAPQPPYVFQLGAGQVIPGFDEGVAGMRLGGQRQLIIPPALGYGSQAAGPIPPNSILVFTIEVVSAQ